jgi:hypothetical protein
MCCCRNKSVVDKYAKDVINCYARGFAKDVVMGAALRTAVNDLRLVAAQHAYENEVENIKKENARIASLHAAEVEVKVLKEQQYKKVRCRLRCSRCSSTRKELYLHSTQHNVVRKGESAKEISHLLRLKFVFFPRLEPG